MQEELFPQEELLNKNDLSSYEGLFPIGKYINKPINEVLKNYNYCRYLMSRSWFREKYNNIYQIFISNFGESEDTPEHNVLQAQFLDINFCLALGKLCNLKTMRMKGCYWEINDVIKNIAISPDTYKYNSIKKDEDIHELKSLQKYLSEEVYEKDDIDYYEDRPLFELISEFEQDGWDVLIRYKCSFCADCLAFKYCSINQNQIGIEIKPSIGDDYPSILRQMKTNSTHPDFQCLVFDTFCTTSVSLEQVKGIFSASNIKLFSFTEIENSNQLLLSNVNK